MANATVTRKATPQKFILTLTADQMQCVRSALFPCTGKSSVAAAIRDEVNTALKAAGANNHDAFTSADRVLFARRDTDTAIAPITIVDGGPGKIEKVTLELSLAEAQALTVVTGGMAGDTMENANIYCALSRDISRTANNPFVFKNPEFYPAPFLTKK